MRFRHFVITILGLAVMVFGSVPGSTGTLRNSSGRVLPQAVHGTAYAALQPVGAAEGWGRVTVRDDDLPSGLHRTVQVWLFGMEPRTEYRIEVNSVEIGTIMTRSSGSGVLKLQNRGSGHDAVPEELPSVDLLESTVVFEGETPTLQGTFSVAVHPGGDTDYEEEIVLVEENGSNAVGMAKVEMEDGGHQEFKTHASGLMPEALYEVVVNGFKIASPTSDEQGQAQVHLEHPDDDNPLPPELLPVSRIETVQWWVSEGDLVLSGTFTGVGVCQHLTGTVTDIEEGGFTILTDGGTVRVLTSDDTEWDDFPDREVAVGDVVKVEGCWDGDDFIAEEVELKNGGDEEACTKLVGTIGNVSGENFILDTDDGSVMVLVTEDTEWDDFDDHELTIGDMVKVEGCWDGDVFVAHEVELMSDDDEESCTTFVGTVTEGDHNGFTLETDSGSVIVGITGETEWLDFGGHELAVGDKVKVRGCWDGEVFVAEEVELKSGDTPGQRCTHLVGVVTDVSLDGFTMDAGGGSVRVLITNETEWDDFDGHEIAVGDKVRVDGCWDGEVFVASEVELKKPA